MSDDQKSQLIDNLVAPLKTVPRFIQVRQLGHFFEADADYGARVAAALGIPVDEIDGRKAVWGPRPVGSTAARSTCWAHRSCRWRFRPSAAKRAAVLLCLRPRTTAAADPLPQRRDFGG